MCIYSENKEANTSMVNLEWKLVFFPIRTSFMSFEVSQIFSEFKKQIYS